MTIQKILLRYEPKKENLLRVIKDINVQFGFLSPEATHEVAKYFEMAPAAVFSTASFYEHIRTKRPAGLVIQVCDGTNCQTKGSDQIISEIESFLGQKVGDEFNPSVRIERISCIGKCLVGPVMIINETVFERVNPSKVDDILRGYAK